MNGCITGSARRGKIASLGIALCLAFGLLAQGAAAAPDPQSPVRDLYGVLLTNMQQGRALGESGRYARLEPVVVRTFDIPYMTRLAIGPSWNNLSSPQQQRLVAAFAHYVGATYADRFDAYSGEQLQVVGERPFGEGFMVRTTIVKSNGEATRLDYLMRQDGGTWKIADVYLDGSISQLSVHRSEFHSILRREGVEGLVTALNHKVDLLKGGVARAS